MRILGLLFIIGGVMLCLTFFFIMPGLLSVGVGALLMIAAGNKPTSRGTKIAAWIFGGACGFLVLLVGLVIWTWPTSKPTPTASTVGAPTAVSIPAHKSKKHTSAAESPGR